MKFIMNIRFKPKPDYLDEFVNKYHKITEEAFIEGSVDKYFTAIFEDEIIYVGIFNEKEKNTKIIDKGIEWIEKYRHMLQPYSKDKYIIKELGKIIND